MMEAEKSKDTGYIMQTYVLLALAGFLIVVVAGISIGTLLRRARPTRMPIHTQHVALPQPVKTVEPVAVLPFDDSALTDETQPARPVALVEFASLPDTTRILVGTPPVLAPADEDALDADQITLLIEPDDEPSPHQRNVRRLIAYFNDKRSTSETAAIG